MLGRVWRRFLLLFCILYTFFISTLPSLCPFYMGICYRWGVEGQREIKEGYVWGLLLLALFAIVLKASWDSYRLGDREVHSVEAKRLGDVVEAAVQSLNRQQLVVTSDMKIEILIDAPCEGTPGEGKCFVVHLVRRSAVPRSSHEVAEVIVGEGINDVRTVKIF